MKGTLNIMARSAARKALQETLTVVSKELFYEVKFESIAKFPS